MTTDSSTKFVHIYESNFGSVPVRTVTYLPTFTEVETVVAGCCHTDCCPPVEKIRIQNIDGIMTMDGRWWTEDELNNEAERLTLEGLPLWEAFLG